jgi:type IV pilus assembly protein PilY1
MFGTGKLNEDSDATDTANRGFYSVVDKSPSSALTVPATELAVISTFTSPSLGNGLVGRNWSTPNLAGKLGWKFAFTGGERVLGNSTLPSDTGTVLFATTKPVGDMCTPGNAGFLMAANICSGKTGDLVFNGVTVGGIQGEGNTKIGISTTDPFNKPIVTSNLEGCKGLKCELKPPGVPRGRYSWREILTK